MREIMIKTKEWPEINGYTPFVFGPLFIKLYSRVLVLLMSTCNKKFYIYAFL